MNNTYTTIAWVDPYAGRAKALVWIEGNDPHGAMECARNMEHQTTVYVLESDDPLGESKAMVLDAVGKLWLPAYQV